VSRVATRYADYVAHQGPRARARSFVRDLAVTGLSRTRRGAPASGCVRFVLYHHVFDDEREGFARQLRFMRRFGDFVSIDDAIRLLGAGERADGCCFCVTVDDGYRNSVTNALPILDQLHVPAAFFVITGMVGTTIEDDRPRLEKHFAGGALVEFMDWDECRQLEHAGMVIGSHTASHVGLARLDEEALRRELAGSKQTIESQLGAPCEHFCCPFGVPGVDFNAHRDPAVASDVGYRSFATGVRGAMRPGDSPLFVRRDQLLANWGLSQVRYFLGR
jgi:peptidoglycan/xylan/chitin deacetylase (PgdA/CDA1 family)